MKTIKFFGIAFLFLLAMLPNSVFSSELQKTFNRTFEFTPGGNFTLENYRGDIKIHSGDFKSVEVKAVIKVNYADEKAANNLLQKTDVAIKDSKLNNIVLEAATDKELINEMSRSISNTILNITSIAPILAIDFEVNVPREVNLTLNTYKGIISAAGIQGNVKAKSYKGDVNFSNIRGGVNAETYKALLELDGIEGEIHAKNYKGAVHIKQIDGSAIAENYKDNIDYQLTRLANQKMFEFKNYKGGLVVALPGSLNANVSIKNFKGDINSEFAIKAMGTLAKDKMTGQINNGGIPLTISNYKGTIELKKL